MKMTINELAILSELENEPSHGYELATKTGTRVTSIYNTLGALEKKGFVSNSINGKQRVYSLTESGKLALSDERQWFLSKWYPFLK